MPCGINYQRILDLLVVKPARAVHLLPYIEPIRLNYANTQAAVMLSSPPPRSDA